MKIMAVHGLWFHSSCWEAFRQCFPEDTFLTPDIDWAKLDWAELEALLLSFNPTLLLGHSFGGYVAQKFLEKNPAGAKLCVLIAPSGPRGIGISSFLKIITAFPWPFIEGLIKGRFKPDRHRSVVRQLLFGGFSDKVFEKYYPGLIREQRISILRILPFCGNVRKPIEVPGLVISGGLDMSVSKAEADAIAKFHGADRIHFPNHGHMLLTEPVAHQIREWVNNATGQ